MKSLKNYNKKIYTYHYLDLPFLTSGMTWNVSDKYLNIPAVGSKIKVLDILDFDAFVDDKERIVNKIYKVEDIWPTGVVHITDSDGECFKLIGFKYSLK